MTSPHQSEYFTDAQLARMLGLNPVTLRKWRTKNKKLGVIKYGPPYEFHGPNVLYPAGKFREWCSQVRMVNGVPCMNLPVGSTIPHPEGVAA